MEPKPRQLVEYLDAQGNNPFRDWLTGLRDKKGRGVIQVRLQRLTNGNFGDCKPIGENVHEFRIDFGPGYRVYFGEDGDKVVLLGGGDKSTQAADIAKAKQRWE